MDNVSALKALYEALGGNAIEVANATTIVEVLNAIAAMYGSTKVATQNTDAIMNIVEIVPEIVGGDDN